jgi:hypothetical protein
MAAAHNGFEPFTCRAGVPPPGRRLATVPS